MMNVFHATTLNTVQLPEIVMKINHRHARHKRPAMANILFLFTLNITIYDDCSALYSSCFANVKQGKENSTAVCALAQFNATND